MTKLKSVLNQELVEMQDLRKSEIAALENLHKTLDQVFEAMNTLDAKNEPQVAEVFAELVEQIEFSMQRNWRFPESSDFHTWWLRSPKCECPTLDNEDNYGTPYRVTNGGCPWHLFKFKKKPDDE